MRIYETVHPNAAERALGGEPCFFIMQSALWQPGARWGYVIALSRRQRRPRLIVLRRLEMMLTVSYQKQILHHVQWDVTYRFGKSDDNVMLFESGIATRLGPLRIVSAANSDCFA
jgi:hypothetical protein